MSEAEYWTWVLNELRANPNGTSIPEESGRRAGATNLSLITTDPAATDHLNDTRAEENGWNGQFLATAAAFLPGVARSAEWEAAGRCFGFHVFSRGETGCGIKTRTTADDGTLGNHNLWPSPLYTIAGITCLQQGQHSYALAAQTAPSEFNHGIEARLALPVWTINVAGCMTEQLQPVSAQVHGRLVVAQYDANAHETDDVSQNRVDSGFGLGVNVSGTSDWRAMSYAMQTAPTARYIRFRAPVGLQGTAVGKVWFDAIRLE